MTAKLKLPWWVRLPKRKGRINNPGVWSTLTDGGLLLVPGRGSASMPLVKHNSSGRIQLL